MGLRGAGSLAGLLGHSMDRRALGLVVGLAAAALGRERGGAKKRKKRPLTVADLVMETSAGDRFVGSVVFTSFVANTANDGVVAVGTFKGVVTRADLTSDPVEASGVDIDLGGIAPGEAPRADVGVRVGGRGALDLLLDATTVLLDDLSFQFAARSLPAPLGSKNKKVARKQARAVEAAMTAEGVQDWQGMADALNRLVRTY